MRPGEIKKLTKELGAPYLDLIPPDQHKWQGEAGMPPLIRIWSWLCGHTIHWNGQERSAFAIDKEGHELRLERIADDLDMDAGNVRQYWAEGVKLGLWRNGTKEEGRHRLYLCGEVKPVKEKLEMPDPKDKPAVDEAVYTYRSKRMRPYLLAQVNAMPQDAQDSYWAEWTPRHLAADQSFAELTACHRQVTDEDDDNQFARYAVKKIRETHKPKGTPEEIAAKVKEAEARRQRILALRPEVERYVRTVEKLVCEQEKSAGIPPKMESTDPTTLLPQRTTREEPERAGESLSTATPEHGQTPPDERRSANKQLPAGETLVSSPRSSQSPNSAPRVLTPEEADGEATLYAELKKMQEAYPRSEFAAQAISRKRRCDQIVVRRILDSVRPENVRDFLLDVARKFKGLDTNALGKSPGRAPGMSSGPRSIALIEIWARDYADHLDESARATAEAEAAHRAEEARACRDLITDRAETDTAKRWARERLQQLEGEQASHA